MISGGVKETVKWYFQTQKISSPSDDQTVESLVHKITNPKVFKSCKFLDKELILFNDVFCQSYDKKYS